MCGLALDTGGGIGATNGGIGGANVCMPIGTGGGVGRGADVAVAGDIDGGALLLQSNGFDVNFNTYNCTHSVCARVRSSL